jgi:hypothetical protein
VSSDVIPIVLGIIIAALIFWGGRASQPRRSARFDKFQRRSIDAAPAPQPNQGGAPTEPAPTSDQDPAKYRP